MNRQRNILLKNLERLPHSVAGNAATNGIKLGDKLVHLTTGILRDNRGLNRVVRRCLGQVGRCRFRWCYGVVLGPSRSRITPFLGCAFIKVGKTSVSFRHVTRTLATGYQISDRSI